MKQISKIVGGILLVAGTTIGAAILALPVTTGLMGFFPSLIVFIFYWVLTTFSATCFLEVNLWLKDHNVNIISMAKQTIGRFGEVIAWVLYLLLLYMLTTAYMAGSAPFFLLIIKNLFGMEVPAWVGPLPMLIIFSFFVYEGAKWVDYANRILMLGLALTFVLLNVLLLPHIEPENLLYQNWSMMPIALALIATSFGYHIIIPTLTRYLNRDARALLIVILIGGSIPFFINAIWEFVALGMIPLEGKMGIFAGFKSGTNAVNLISHMLGNSWLMILSQVFLFFAIVTSFLGVSLSLRDFLADGIGIKKTFAGRWILYFLTFVPPLFFVMMDPRIFFTALDYAGAFGVLILLVIMPALMVWYGRYVHGYESPEFKAPGGKFTLALAIIVSVIIVIVEIGNKAGLIQYF